jgi:hypothetical protein
MWKVPRYLLTTSSGSRAEDIFERGLDNSLNGFIMLYLPSWSSGCVYPFPVQTFCTDAKMTIIQKVRGVAPPLMLKQRSIPRRHAQLNRVVVHQTFNIPLFLTHPIPLVRAVRQGPVAVLSRIVHPPSRLSISVSKDCSRTRAFPA